MMFGFGFHKKFDLTATQLQFPMLPITNADVCTILSSRVLLSVSSCGLRLQINY